MKFVVQRVDSASVCVNEKIIGQIGQGYLVLMGVGASDTKEIADKMVHKLLNLRIFEDENGKTNLDLKNVNGELLIVSQFTLYADCHKGNRPSFVNAGSPQTACELYEYVLEKCKESISIVEKGEFGAHMQISLVNHGPFTIILDSDELFK